MNLDIIVPLLYPAAILACLLSLWRPQIGLYYLVFVLPLQTLRYQIPGYPLGNSIIDVVLLGVMIGMLLNRTAPLFADLPMKWLLAAAALYWYISLWHGSFVLGLPWPIALADPRFSNWKNYIELSLLFGITFAVIRTKEQIRVVLVIMCVTAFAVSYDFFQFMSAQDLSQYSDKLRYAGVMGYAGVNGLAAFEAQFALFLTGLYNSKLPKGYKIAISLVLAGCTYAVLFAFSRGAYMAFAAGLLFVGIMRKRFILVVLMAVLLGGSMFLPAAVMERITGTYTQESGSDQGTLESSAQERVIIWQDAMEVVKTFPVRGTGFDTYHYMHRSLGYGDTHNFYLKVLVEEGIVGLLFLIAILWKMLRQGYGLFRISSDPLLSSLGLGFAACIVGALVTNFFGDRWSYQQVDSYWWILLALVCRARLLESDSGEEPAPEAELVPEGAMS